MVKSLSKKAKKVIVRRVKGVHKEIFPSSDTQRCTRHRMENVLNKVLKEDRNAVKDSLSMTN